MKNNKITCGICGGKFPDCEMTGRQVGIWFVICCEKCKKKKEETWEVVYEPPDKRGLK